MKTIKEIKDEVAKENGWEDWDQLSYRETIGDWWIHKVAEKYAEEVIKECADRATAYLGFDDKPTVSKKSILDIINELK